MFLACGGCLLLGGILWALRRTPEAFEKAGLSLLFAAAVIGSAFAKHADAPGLLLFPPPRSSRASRRRVVTPPYAL